MSVEDLSNEEIQRYIRDNAGQDVRALALKKPPVSGWPYAEILQQIQARQKAEKKIPAWCVKGDLIFPAPDVVEQASSQATALYKKIIIQPEKVFVDLTAGVGVDSWAISQRHEKAICVERNARTAESLQHNMPILCECPVSVVTMQAESFVQDMEFVDLVFLDPGRRDGGAKGNNFLADGVPNILELLPVLRDKTKKILLKTSPMLDIARAIEDLEVAGGVVEAVHILEWRGECKEVLYSIGFEAVAHVPVHACILDDQGGVLFRHDFVWREEHQASVSFSDPQSYIYEPAACVMKSGGFKTLAQSFGLEKLHPHTHLYTAEAVIPDFPGRCFRFEGSYPAQAKALPVKKGNLSVRNFPAHVDVLKKKLKLKDGGHDYLFACTLMGEKRTILHVRKAVQ